MVSTPSSARSGSSGHRFGAVFLFGILIPGIVLVVFSIRALLQEETLANQQLRERLEQVAELGGDLQQHFQKLDGALPASVRAGGDERTD